MKYDELRCAVEKIQDLRRQLAATKEALRALGVTDLPGDAPNLKATLEGSTAPVLPWKPSWAMTAAVRKTLEANGYLIPDGPVETALSAAAAVAPKPAPGNLPEEPTDAMIEAAMHAQPGGIQPAGIGLLSGPELARILRAALAAAPRVEVPEIPAPTPADAVLALRKFGGHGEGSQFCQEQIVAMLGALRAVRVEQIARMGAKS